MNILYTTFSFNTGGIEKLLIDIVNEASKNKNNQIYLCIINDNYDKFLIDSINRSVNIIFLKRPVGGKRLKYIIEYAKIILKNKIDIIHCQAENEVKFSVISKVLRPRIKIFTTVHDTDYVNLKFQDVLIDKLFCSKIIAISEAVREQVISRGIPGEKVVKIYNGIDFEKFSWDREKVYESTKQIIIGNVSRLIPETKGQDLLIKAVALLKEKYPNIKCLLGGEAPGKNKLILCQLKQLCKKLNVSENIIFCGNIRNVPEFLNSMDIFILPSRFEGFGISLIEAMYSGIPCIATNIDGPREIIKDNKYGLLFENNNYEDLARKIEYRINNMKIDRLEIKSYIESKFNIINMVDNLFQNYSG